MKNGLEVYLSSLKSRWRGLGQTVRHHGLQASMSVPAYKMAPPMAEPAGGAMEEGKQGRDDGQGTWRPAKTGANIAPGY